ncbi:MAG TPA: hypothetical protein VIS27_07055, partial [Yeosuana sp.]
AKLSHEGHYKAKPKTKSGKVAVRKDALSTIIGNLCDMAEPDAASLEKSNKNALEKVIFTIEALTNALAFYEAPAEEDDESDESDDAEIVDSGLTAEQEADAIAEQEAEEISEVMEDSNSKDAESV